MSASDDARRAISEVVVVLPCEVDSMLDTDEVRHTFGHLPIVLHVCDEVDRLRAENAALRDDLVDMIVAVKEADRG